MTLPHLVRAAIEWEIRDWDEVAADISFKLRYLRQVYEAFLAYHNAGARGATVEWTKAQPQMWDFVSGILARQRGLIDAG